MDPLTVFGVAANVVSFISFASDLIKTTVELYRSDSDATTDLLSLEKVYGDLKDLSSKLGQICQQPIAEFDSLSPVPPTDRSLQRTMLAIKSLAGLCKEDCNELLRITDGLRPTRDGDTKSKWKAFRKAMCKILNDGDIRKIENRLHQRQTTLTLHICSISGYYHNEQAKLQSQSVNLQISQKERLEEVKGSLARCEQLLAEVHTHRDHKLVQLSNYEFLGNLARTLDTIQDRQSKMQRFMQSLQFEARPGRHEAISEAHEQTFRWLLRGDEEKGRGKSAFAQWLESKNGIFWVAGKPGSGKSTFMKFVADAARTHELVNRWASPTILVAHYFWSSGSSIQKSLEGLLRSLLCDIFQQRPDIIPLTCEDRWRQLDDPNVPRRAWSLSSLTQTLRKVTAEKTQTRVNICFFIDGLDEYEGSHDDQFELCKLVRELSQSQHIKLCVSSRPWNIFKEAFGTGPKMYIHDLTRNDIRNYVSCRLREHPRWIDLPNPDPTGGQCLIEQIVERCDGVFLWVVLVTRLLREGMTNRDRFTDLYRRLESFPRELGPFFMHILDSVEPIYHAKMVTMLRVALAAEKPLHIFMFDFHDLEHDDEYHYLKRPVVPLTKANLSDVSSRMPYYLDSRTRGLLQVSNAKAVTFLHRTVKDYLTDHALSILPEICLPKGSSRAFSPHLSILRAYAAWVKCATPDILWRHDFADYSGSGATDGITPSILEITTDLIPYAVHLDPLIRWDPRIGEVLNDIDNSIATLITRTRSSACLSRREVWRENQLRHEHRIGIDRITFQPDYAWERPLFFRERLVKAGVTNYVGVKDLNKLTIRGPPAENKRFSDNQHQHTHTILYYYLVALFKLFRWPWKVYLIILKWFLFFLYPFMYGLSSFLMQHLPCCLSRSVIIPFMSILTRFVHDKDY